MFSDFIKNVKYWLSNTGHPYVQSNDNDTEHADNLSVVSDEINPEDSASNISCQQENHSRADSQLFPVSSFRPRCGF